jgi:hypothetical protein
MESSIAVSTCSRSPLALRASEGATIRCTKASAWRPLPGSIATPLMVHCTSDHAATPLSVFPPCAEVWLRTHHATLPPAQSRSRSGRPDSHLDTFQNQVGRGPCLFITFPLFACVRSFMSVRSASINYSLCRWADTRAKQRSSRTWTAVSEPLACVLPPSRLTHSIARYR